MDVSAFEPLATGRRRSLFAPDLEDNHALLLERLAGSRVAVIGAAGSIGSAVVKGLLRYRPRSLVLFDLNENDLVEIVRDLRATPGLRLPDDFAELPIGLGSAELYRFFREQEPCDYVLNLSAMKHVRSEKDVYCLMRMVDTNVLFVDELLGELPRPSTNFLSVSTDKAVNPASLMGATKMVMERVLLLRSARQPFSTARFANVAFSKGSLPLGFLLRVMKRQPIAAPSDVRRYFISHQEAGDLCLLACALGGNGDLFLPKAENLAARSLVEVAAGVLAAFGYEPYECASVEEAKERIADLPDRGKWPCCFSASDTSGEKLVEELHAEDDPLDLARFRAVGVIPQSGRDVDREAVEGFLAFAREAKGAAGITKARYVEELLRVLPTLQHVETGKNLDAKL